MVAWLYNGGQNHPGRAMQVILFYCLLVFIMVGTCVFGITLWGKVWSIYVGMGC
jgi:hypothetical protein